MVDLNDRGQFLRVACLFEGSLIGVAWLVGAVIGVDPLAAFAWDAAAVGRGLLGTIPVLLMFLASEKLPLRSLQRIHEFLLEVLGPLLAACRWYDLLLLAALAGISEELLFRGVLQVGMSHWGLWTGLLLSNLLFGLAHLITVAYAIWAAVAGLLLGLLFDPQLIGLPATQQNLLAPIITHGLYDFIAFLLVARKYRRSHPPSGSAPLPDGEPSQQGASP